MLKVEGEDDNEGIPCPLQFPKQRVVVESTGGSCWLSQLYSTECPLACLGKCHSWAVKPYSNGLIGTYLGRVCMARSFAVEIPRPSSELPDLAAKGGHATKKDTYVPTYCTENESVFPYHLDFQAKAIEFLLSQSCLVPIGGFTSPLIFHRRHSRFCLVALAFLAS